MKTQGKVWIIYDSELKTQTKPMSVVQTQVTLLSLEPIPGRYFLWTPGWEEWICVAEFLDSDQTYFAVQQPPQPKDLQSDTITSSIQRTSKESIYTHVVVGVQPLRSVEIGGYHVKDFNGDELDLKNLNKSQKKKKKSLPAEDLQETSDPDRRRDTRHNFKIEVVLVSKVRSFRTYSKNISISGTLLEHEVPKDFLNTPFDLIIVNPFEPNPGKSRLLFRANIVGDVEDPRRLMFIEQDTAMTSQLSALLAAYVAYQDQVRSNAG